MELILDSFDDLLDCSIKINTEYPETSAYIKSVLKSFLHTTNTGSNKSIVLAWYQAKKEYSFPCFQNIGDNILFTNIMFPESVQDISFYTDIGRASYYRCYKYLNGSWPLYEELADKFDYFVYNVRESLLTR